MKEVKKSFVIVMGLFLLVCFLFATEENIRFTLPVRVFDGKQAVIGLQKQDFRLMINEQQRDILEAVEKTASLSQKPEFLGRNFVLSFHLLDYSNQVQEAIAYFVTEILTNADTLILVTHLKIYRINVTANKEKMIREVQQLVQKDCDETRKQLHAAEKNLETQMKRMVGLCRGEIRDPGHATSFKMLNTFLSTFPQRFLNFRDQFLFPNINRYRQVLDFIGNREGERWWVHLQQGEIFRLIPGIQEAVREIHNYMDNFAVDSYGSMTILSQFEKQLQLSHGFPVESMSNIFIQGNIRCNAVLWENPQNQEPGSGANPISELRRIYSQVSNDTGGKTVYTLHPEQGIKDIRNHRDSYYQLAYNFDGSTTGEKISVTTTSPDTPKLKLTYKNHYTDEEIRAMVQYLSRGRVQISDFSSSKDRIKFSINSISLNKDKGDAFGLVRVRIELFSQGGQRVYHTENTLRSSRQKITLTIPLPSQHKGKFNLAITACDLMANQLAVFEQEVVLK